MRGINNDDRLLTVKELADYLHVRKSWIYDRTRLNQIPYIRLGKYLRFRPNEVIEHFGKGRDE